MNVPNEQNGANAIIGSVTKKNFYPNISKFPTLESYLGSTFYFKAPQNWNLENISVKGSFFPSRTYKKEFTICISCCPMYHYDKIALTIILKVRKKLSSF